MDLYCYLCDKKFESIKKFIDHLKYDEYIEDGTTNMKCGFIGCTNHYQKFDSLRRHLKVCVPKCTVSEITNECQVIRHEKLKIW